MKKILLSATTLIIATLFAQAQPKLTNFGVFDDFSTTKDYSSGVSTRGIYWWKETNVTSMTRDTVKKQLIIHATQGEYQYVPFGFGFGGTATNPNTVDLSSNGTWSFDITNYGTEDLFLRVSCTDNLQRVVDCNYIPNPDNKPFDKLEVWAYQVQILIPAGKTVTFKAGTGNEAGKGYLNSCDFGNGTGTNWGTWDNASQSHLGASVYYNCNIKKFTGVSITPMNAAKNTKDQHALPLVDGYFGLSNFIVGDTSVKAFSAIDPKIAFSDTTTTIADTAKSTAKVNITSYTGPWYALSDQSWLSAQIDTSVSGKGTVTFIGVANPTIASRKATVTLSSKYGISKNIVVTQNPGKLEISANKKAFTNAEETTTIDIKSVSTWTATSSVTWLTLSPISASGNGTLTITAAANTGIARSGSVTITSPGATTQVISVTQAKAPTTGFEIKELEQKSYRIVGNTIYFDNTETTVYTILGQPVSAFGNTSVTLPEGIYILNTPLGNEKVIITK